MIIRDGTAGLGLGLVENKSRDP